MVPTKTLSSAGRIFKEIEIQRIDKYYEYTATHPMSNVVFVQKIESLYKEIWNDSFGWGIDLLP